MARPPSRRRRRSFPSTRIAMADDDEDAGALSDVDEDPLPPPPPPSASSSKPPPQPKPNHAADSAQQQQRLLDLSAELEEERRLRRAAEESLASSETRLGRIKAFAEDALRKRDESSASAAASARAFAALQAEVSTASSMLYQIAIEVSELEAAVASRDADAEYLTKSLPDRETEVYTLAGALENSMKGSQIKIIELQHLVEAQRAESGLLRTRMEGQAKEIGQLRKQIKHLEEKERLANDSVEGLMKDVEEIKTWKMAAEEEADAGRSIEQEFQIQALQAEATTASSMLSSGLERISAKASPSTPPAPLPTSHKYSAGLPALAYGVLKRANDIIDDLLAQIAAARRRSDERNYQIAIDVSELEAAVASRATEAESISKSISDRASAPLHCGLPQEIVIWEILVRLPPNSLLRCRAVCHAWRRATSTRDFLLAHHDRQPTLSILHHYDSGPSYLDIIPFDHRAWDQFEPITRVGYSSITVETSCDGLLLLFDRLSDDDQYGIFNPATRQYAPLPQLDSFTLLGMYPHTPSGEYRLLLLTTDEVDEVEPGACHVFELGSCQPPRDIGYEWPDLGHDSLASEAVLFRGGLHWHLDERESGSNMVMMFDTTAESFRQMRSAIPGGHGVLFEMDGMLAMCTFDDGPPAKVIDIWVLKDYESEAWAFKCRVGLPVEEFKVQFEMFYYWTNVAMSCDGDLLFLVASHKRLLQVDIDGKVVASSHTDHTYPTQLRLKQTLVSHTFFQKLEGYVVNAPPFF